MKEAFSPRLTQNLPMGAVVAMVALAIPIAGLAQGTISVFAGTGNPPITPGAIGDGGPAKNAFLDGPDSVTLDTAGNVYIREKARVRKVTPAGTITTVAGTGTNGFSGDGGPATSAKLGLGPQRAGLATDSAGNLYIADSNNYRVRKVDTSGIITTVAGNGQIGLGSNGDNGPAINVALCFPSGVAVDSAGNIYVASSICNGVRKVDPSGIITTVAKNSAGPSYGVAVDSAGLLYLNAGGVGSQIRRVNADATITVVAGTGVGNGFSGDGGPATSAQLFEVDGLAIDPAGNIFITDSGNSRIREVDTSGIINTVAGHGSVGPGLGCPNLFTTGCPATNLKFSGSDIALDPLGNFYTANFVSGLVYKVAAGTAGPSCTYTLDTGGQAFPSAGGNGTINITTQAGCAWSVSSPPAWVTNATSGTGSGALTYQVTANSGAGRTATITIAGVSYVVEQQAASISGLALIGSMPHLAASENWTTAFTMVNKGAVPATARLSLFGDANNPGGNGPLTLPLAFAQQAAGPLLGATFDRTLAANASLIVNTSGAQVPPVLVGSAQLAATGAVDGFAIFHQIVTTQEAVVPMETRDSASYLLPFDNTSGLVLGVALENLSAQNVVIPVIVRDENGLVISAPGASISVPGNGHFSFVLSDVAQGFPATANIRGTIEFDTPAGGRISVLGLRFSPPNSALTTIPAFANIGTGGGSIAHLASGGDGWQTTFVLVNTGTSAADFTLSFFADQTGLPMALPLSFPQPNGGTDTVAPSVTQNLPAGAMRVIVSTGAASLLTGSAQLATAGHLGGFVIFRHNNQEAVVPLENRNAAGYIIAFDNTAGTATGIAVNAVSAAPVNIPVTVRNSSGGTIASDTIALIANGHYAFTLVSDRYPGTAGIRGTIQFDTPAGAQIGALGIRIPSVAAHTYTTLPALAK